MHIDVPDGMVSESVESRLLHSSSGFSAPVSCGTIRLGWGAKTAEVTTALCAEKRVRFAVSAIISGLKRVDRYTMRYLLWLPRSHCGLVAQT